jgi:hypothetical protein
MLYFSETHWAPPDLMEVNDAFERDYDSAEYEHKIGALIRNFRANARKNNRDEFDAWREAVRTLRSEDHYLLVLIDVADGSLRAGGQDSPVVSWSRVLKISAYAFLVLCILFAIVIGYFSIRR